MSKTGFSPFMWGVATAAYQVEGRLNGPGEPQNNWAPWDRAGRVEPVGDAVRFWDAPEELLDRAAALGCTAFRLSIEWARVQPAAGVWDPGALDRYADILCRCRARGLEPVVTLFHFTHPLWCGPDLWPRPDAPRRFADYARRCVCELGRRLAERGEAPVRWWITLNEPAALAIFTYLFGGIPGSGRNSRLIAPSLDHSIAAHVLGYDAVHDVYTDEGWPAPMVSTNAFATSVVAFDAAIVDALLARERGVPRADLNAYLGAAYTTARARLASLGRDGPAAAVLDTALDRWARFAGLRPQGATLSALYASSRARKLDYIALDYYDPIDAHRFLPARGVARKLRSRWWLSSSWEKAVDPAGFGVILRQAHLQAPDRPILVAENGMCTAGAHARPDGVTREDFLRSMCGELIRAREGGLPIAGYLHWSLVDNYEWGSYRPRFGIHGVDRRDGIRILDADALGDDAASVYRDIIARNLDRTAPVSRDRTASTRAGKERGHRRDDLIRPARSL